MSLLDAQVRGALAYASGNADRNGAVLDMSGFEEVLAIVSLAAINNAATTSIKWQQGNRADGGDMADLTGTGRAIAGTDDDTWRWSLLVKPTARYVRIVVDKDGANACAESVLYIQSGARGVRALAAVAGETAGSVHVSPALGTP